MYERLAHIVMGSGLQRTAADPGDQLEDVLADTQRWMSEHRHVGPRSINLASASLNPNP